MGFANESSTGNVEQFSVAHRQKAHIHFVFEYSELNPPDFVVVLRGTKTVLFCVALLRFRFLHCRYNIRKLVFHL